MENKNLLIPHHFQFHMNTFAFFNFHIHDGFSLELIESFVCICELLLLYSPAPENFKRSQWKFSKMFPEPTIRNSAKYLAIGDSRNNICQKTSRKSINHNRAAIFFHFSPSSREKYLPETSSKKLELTLESRGTLQPPASYEFTCCGCVWSPPFIKRRQIAASSPMAEYTPCSSLRVLLKLDRNVYYWILK